MYIPSHRPNLYLGTPGIRGGIQKSEINQLPRILVNLKAQKETLTNLETLILFSCGPSFLPKSSYFFQINNSKYPVVPATTASDSR